MELCRKCGKEVNAGAQACPNCGAPQPLAAPAGRPRPWVMIGFGVLAAGVLAIPMAISVHQQHRNDHAIAACLARDAARGQALDPMAFRRDVAREEAGFGVSEALAIRIVCNTGGQLENPETFRAHASS